MLDSDHIQEIADIVTSDDDPVQAACIVIGAMARIIAMNRGDNTAILALRIFAKAAEDAIRNGTSAREAVERATTRIN